MISSKAIGLLREEYAMAGDMLEMRHMGNETVVLHEKSTAPLEKSLNVIAPFSFRTVTVEGERVIHCSIYPELRDIAGTFFDRWSGAPFSADALSALHAALLPTLASWGYDGSKFPCRCGVARLLSERGVAEQPKRENVRILNENDAKRPSLVTMHLSDGIARGAAGYITERGEVAAMAAVNGALDVHQLSEIGVECAPQYRRQGIGAAVTACLCAHLLDMGKTPLYCHYHDNLASAALAERVGFLPVGAFYTYQAWKRS